MDQANRHHTRATPPAPVVPDPTKLPTIFGLRYLEEDEADIHDVVGCNLVRTISPSCCDDLDHTN